MQRTVCRPESGYMGAVESGMTNLFFGNRITFSSRSRWKIESSKSAWIGVLRTQQRQRSQFFIGTCLNSPETTRSLHAYPMDTNFPSGITRQIDQIDKNTFAIHLSIWLPHPGFCLYSPGDSSGSFPLTTSIPGSQRCSNSAGQIRINCHQLLHY